MNILAYIIYLAITSVITIRVGRICYENGFCFIERLMKDDEHLSRTINNILLTCYYLLNLGYAAVRIYFWQQVDALPALISSIAEMTGSIVLTLALLHYMNMSCIYIYSRIRNNFNHHKNQTI